jgi:hypothetical protein
LKEGRMKRIVRILFFSIFVAANAQEIVKNPKNPLNENAGRALNLIEVMRIKGDGEGYYYNGAHKLLIDLSGNIYISDSWSTSQRSHLLKFSPEGLFLKDLYKQGEGPGEIQSMYNFSVNESEIFIYDYMKRKIIVMKQDGAFIDELKIKEFFSDFAGVYGDWLVFVRKDNPFERKTSRLYDVNNVIVFVSKEGKDKKDFYTFRNQEFFVTLAQGGGGMNWDPFIIEKAGSKIFVCCSREYLIEVLDLETGEIVSKFKREYPRVKYVTRDWEKKFYKKWNPPKKKYDTDIKELFFGGGFLWIKTSTTDKENGHLYDLFDSQGKFVDSFYVNIKGSLVKIGKGFLFSSESDEEGLPYVVKYKIEDSLGTR